MVGNRVSKGLLCVNSHRVTETQSKPELILCVSVTLWFNFELLDGCPALDRRWRKGGPKLPGCYLF